MTAFRPLPPRKSIQIVEAAGIPHAKRLIRDQAAAALVRSYAMKIETIAHSGRSQCTRGDTIPPELWQRIVSERVDDDVWIGGTVRLARSDLIGGAPAVNITEIGFNESDLHGMIDRQCGVSRKAKRVKIEAAVSTSTPLDGTEELASKRKTRAADPSVIPPGALLTTLKIAGVALGYGRTTINKLAVSGRLVRVDTGAGVRITVASIRALAGGN